MKLLHSVWSFGSTCEEMVHLWIVFCRSVLEQSCVLWDSGLTQENREDIERTQKTFAKLVLEESYTNYPEALKILQLESLESRRKILTLRFAKAGIEDGILSDLFPKNNKGQKIKTRKREKYIVTRAYTTRFLNSPILTMQRMLNQDHDKNE